MATAAFLSHMFLPSIDALARTLGFEPRSRVLETRILPLNYIPI